MTLNVDGNAYQTRMTWWSRHEPVKLPQGNTDHWSKMKTKCTTFQVNLQGDSLRNPYKTIINRYGANTNDLPGYTRSKSAPPAIVTFRYNEDGTVSRLSERSFHDQINARLSGHLPGSYAMKRPKARPRTAVVTTSFNERAKAGFKYWPMDRPKPTKFGRYGIGAACTVLGLGSACRT
ncbi:uncharacterized protein [Ptychodera flava]|uniref:uncharacterized protein isoform X2 n=1 Tax=Ptychodera flava TaxID=63121 RepID=UPI003969D87A